MRYSVLTASSKSGTNKTVEAIDKTVETTKKAVKATNKTVTATNKTVRARVGPVLDETNEAVERECDVPS